MLLGSGIVATSWNTLCEYFCRTVFRFYSGYTPRDVAELVQSLFDMLKQYPKENLKTVRQKYSHRVFHEVATIPLPSSIDLEDLECDFDVKKEEDFEVKKGY